MQNKYKIPVILYESEEQSLPYIEIEQNDEMPPVLFIQEYKHTGETEPDERGREQAIVDIKIHMYANMEFLGSKLTPELYDEVRVSMGLKPLNEAKKEGKKILDTAMASAEKKVENLKAEKELLKKEAAKEINEKLSEKFFPDKKKNLD